jgi:hypothetical protein
VHELSGGDLLREPLAGRGDVDALQLDPLTPFMISRSAISAAAGPGGNQPSDFGLCSLINSSSCLRTAPRSPQAGHHTDPAPGRPRRPWPSQDGVGAGRPFPRLVIAGIRPPYVPEADRHARRRWSRFGVSYARIRRSVRRGGPR